MSRSKWKGPFTFKKKKTMNRNFEVTLNHVNNKVLIKSGKNNSEIEIKKEMVGFKFGEFVPTRCRHIFKKKR